VVKHELEIPVFIDYPKNAGGGALPAYCAGQASGRLREAMEQAGGSNEVSISEVLLRLQPVKRSGDGKGGHWCMSKGQYFFGTWWIPEKKWLIPSAIRSSAENRAAVRGDLSSIKDNRCITLTVRTAGVCGGHERIRLEKSGCSVYFCRTYACLAAARHPIEGNNNGLFGPVFQGAVVSAPRWDR